MFCLIRVHCWVLTPHPPLPRRCTREAVAFSTVYSCRRALYIDAFLAFVRLGFDIKVRVAEASDGIKGIFAYIGAVLAGGLAERSGLRAGDRITRIGFMVLADIIYPDQVMEFLRVRACFFLFIFFFFFFSFLSFYPLSLFFSFSFPLPFFFSFLPTSRGHTVVFLHCSPPPRRRGAAPPSCKYPSRGCALLSNVRLTQMCGCHLK